jgi:hypothetical protein
MMTDPLIIRLVDHTFTALQRAGFIPDPWNRCDVCGRFIAYADFADGAARVLLTPQSDLSEETFETLCKDHAHE